MAGSLDWKSLLTGQHISNTSKSTHNKEPDSPHHKQVTETSHGFRLYLYIHPQAGFTQQGLLQAEKGHATRASQDHRPTSIFTCTYARVRSSGAYFPRPIVRRLQTWRSFGAPRPRLRNLRHRRKLLPQTTEWSSYWQVVEVSHCARVRNQGTSSSSSCASSSTSQG